MPAEPEALRALQERMFRLITSPRPVDEAAAELAATDPDAGRPERWIVADSREQALSRLAIYANMYFLRLRDVLTSDYPSLAAVVGERYFHNLTIDYLAAHPSTAHSVRHVGRHLPTFARGHALADRYPLLGDLAELEWERGMLIDAEDAEPLTANAMAATPPDAWGELEVTLVPAHRLLSLSYPVHRVWRAVADGQTPPNELAPEATKIIAWRKELTVIHRVIDSHEAALLERLAGGGATLAELGEAVAATAEDAQQASQRLAITLRRWIGDGLLIARETTR